MTYAYCRKPVSEVDNQSVSAVCQWAERNGIQIDEIFFEDEKKSKNTYDKRELGIKLLPLLKKGDYLILSEISCAGRSAQELDQLFNHVLYQKKIKLVCLSMDIHIDFSNLTQEDGAFLDRISFAAHLQTTIVKEYTSYALKMKKTRGEKTGGGSTKWKDSYIKKSKQQKEEEYERRGLSKNLHFLRRKDTFVFFRILTNIFPDETADDNIIAWNWGNINTKNGNYITIMSLMKQCQTIDPLLFSKVDFNDISSRQSQVRIASYLQNLRNSLKSAEKKVGEITKKKYLGNETMKLLGLTKNLVKFLESNNNSFNGEKITQKIQTTESKSGSIKISSDSISKFKSKK